MAEDDTYDDVKFLRIIRFLASFGDPTCFNSGRGDSQYIRWHDSTEADLPGSMNERQAQT